MSYCIKCSNNLLLQVWSKSSGSLRRDFHSTPDLTEHAPQPTRTRSSEDVHGNIFYRQVITDHLMKPITPRMHQNRRNLTYVL